MGRKINGMKEGWLIVGVTNTHSENSTHRLGLCGAQHYVGPGQICCERWLLPRVRDCCSTCLYSCLVSGTVRCNQPTFCLHCEIQPIRWQMTNITIICTQTSMCLSHFPLRTRPRPCNLNLDSLVKIQCRQWRMLQTRWCLTHWRRRRRCTKYISLGHRALCACFFAFASLLCPDYLSRFPSTVLNSVHHNIDLFSIHEWAMS